MAAPKNENLGKIVTRKNEHFYIYRNEGWNNRGYNVGTNKDIFSYSLNPSNAEATFLQSTRPQRFLKNI